MAVSPPVTYFPMSSFPNLMDNGQLTPFKGGCFVFDLEVKPGWIRCNPNEVTVLSCNQMFQPIFPVSPMLNVQEHTLSVKTQHDFETLQEMFPRPIVLCATRRQEDEAMIDGLDTDFVIVISTRPIPVSRKSCRESQISLAKSWKGEKKFYLTIDITDKLDDVSPLEYRSDIFWLHCGFYMTNFSSPYEILYRDVFCIWCFVVPCCLLVEVPYRIYRKLRCKKVDFDCRLELKMSYTVPPILQCFSTDKPFPGRYLQHAKKYNPCLRRPPEIRSPIAVSECQS